MTQKKQKLTDTKNYHFLELVMMFVLYSVASKSSLSMSCKGSSSILFSPSTIGWIANLKTGHWPVTVRGRGGEAKIVIADWRNGSVVAFVICHRNQKSVCYPNSNFFFLLPFDEEKKSAHFQWVLFELSFFVFGTSLNPRTFLLFVFWVAWWCETCYQKKKVVGGECELWQGPYLAQKHFRLCCPVEDWPNLGWPTQDVPKEFFCGPEWWPEYLVRCRVPCPVLSF